MKTFACIGNETVGSYLRNALGDSYCEVDTASNADVVFTYCTNASALEDAYFDDEGIVKCARENTLVVNLSPCPFSLARELAAVATVNNLNYVEAPIALIDTFAQSPFESRTNIVCYVGGEDESVEMAAGLLELVAGLVKRAGRVEDAQMAKAAHTIQTCAQLVSMVEAEALCRMMPSSLKQQDEPSTIEPLSSISSLALQAIEAKRFSGDYTIEMLMGDTAAVLTSAEESEVVLPQLEAATHMLELVAVVGGADLAPSALSLLFSDEEQGAAAGLDWARANDFYAHDAGYDEHEHHHVLEREFDDDYDDYDDYDDGLRFGGFGIYAEE